MRRLFLVGFMALWSGLVLIPTAYAMDQPIFGGTLDNLSGTATEYVRINDNGQTWHGTIARSYTAVPANVSGKFKNLKVHVTIAPGAGTSYAFTLMVDGVASALTCTISDTAIACSDTTNQVTVTEKQTLSLRSVPTGTPSSLADATWSMLWEGSSAIVIGGTPGNLVNSGTQYEKISGGDSSGSGTIAARSQLNATAGTLKNLYVATDLPSGPGTGKSYQFNVIVDGTASGITCTISDAAANCEDATNTKALTGGEEIVLEHVPSGTPTAADNTWWGIEFVPTTSGESPVWGGDNDSPGTLNTEYNFVHGGEIWDAGESSMYQLNQVCTLRDLYVKAAGAPGSTKSFTFTLRTSDAGNSLLGCAVSDTATTCNDTADDISITDTDNRLSISSVPSATAPTTGRYYWGMTAFIQPASTRNRLIVVD